MATAKLLNIDEIDLTTANSVSQTPFSTISRIPFSGPAWIAIKSAPRYQKRDTEPHDIVKEVRILRMVDHANIIQLLGFSHKQSSILSYGMPYIPCSLHDVLVSPQFSPHPLVSFSSTPSTTVSPKEQHFIFLAKSIMHQLLSALAYLHDPTRSIAHRDIKPENVLLKSDGTAVLIDFGISWQDPANVPEDARKGDLWPEEEGKKYFEVATGTYRAPELLLGARNYDAFATDLWSLGVLFTEFFTPLHLTLEDEDHDEDEDEESGDNPALKPFMIPPHIRVSDPRARWTRYSIFDAERGEIGLAWSIFKVRGTPNETIWPDFGSLPDASKVEFIQVPAINLTTLLPNLPPSTIHSLPPEAPTSHSPPPEMLPTPFDLLHRLLVYPPPRRIRAPVALTHPWFSGGLGLLLPVGYSVKDSIPPEGILMRAWEGKTIGDLLKICLPHTADGE